MRVLALPVALLVALLPAVATAQELRSPAGCQSGGPCEASRNTVTPSAGATSGTLARYLSDLTGISAWKSFTPTITPYGGTIGSYTAVGRYQYDSVKKIVWFNLVLSINIGTATNGFNVFGMPISSGGGPGHAIGRDNGTLAPLLWRLQPGGTGATLQRFDIGNFGTGTLNLEVSGFYEAN